jgi:hypothetical protein
MPRGDVGVTTDQVTRIIPHETTARVRVVLATLALCVLSPSCNNETAGPGVPGPPDPASAVFVTSDIVHFWQAYDAGGKDGVAAAFQRDYLDLASPGLRDFMQARDVTAARLAQMVLAYPRYFAAIRANTLRLAQDPTLLDPVRASYEAIESRYPAAVYPPVTFLIGRFSTGGTIRASGVLVGTEFYAIDDTTPLDELETFRRNNVRPLGSIALIVAHEHVHVQQFRAGGLGTKPDKTLLDQSLLEGSADFVGELVAGAHINGATHAWALPREGQLWVEFQQVMNGTDVSQWLYNQGSATPDRPGDLGYFIGYRIAQRYYDTRPDKNAALREIIEVSDASALLAASGYDGTGP